MGGTLFRKKETTMPRNPFRRFSSKHATSHPTTAQPTLASTQASAHESREARDTKQRRGNSEELLISSVEGVTIESGAPVSADNSTPANGPDQYETHMSLRERQAPAVETPVYQQKPLPHIGSGSPPALSVSRKHDSADNQPVRRWSKAREHILLEQMSSSSPPASRAAKPPQSSNRAISLKDGLVLQTSAYHDRAPVRRRSRAAQQILQEMGRTTTPSPSDQSTESSVEIDTTLSSGSDSGLQKKHSLSPAAADFVYELPVAYSAKLNRRKALLIGIGYQNHKFLHPLPGCKNDVTTMFNLLTSELYAFPQDSIRVLSDELTALGTSHVDAPTRFNILRDMFWLTEDVSEGDSVVFFFAGHGDFIDDVSGDEIETGVDQVRFP